jgi:hypoxanthine phosphoribosyltransferase
VKGEKSLNHNKREKILYSRKDIDIRVKELGAIISENYKEKDLLVVSLLRGSFIFAADLIREISIPVEVDFMTTASYGHSEISSGNVEIITDIRTTIKGRDILIVDDIMDSGFTIEKVKDRIEEEEPNSVKVCVMLDKPTRRKVNLEPNFVGFSIPDVFIVGYGLNYGDHYRNIPYIFTYDDQPTD